MLSESSRSHRSQGMLRRKYLVLSRVRFPLIIVGVVFSGLNVHEQIGRLRYLLHRDGYTLASFEVVGSDLETTVSGNRLRNRHRVLLGILDGKKIRVDARVVDHDYLSMDRNEFAALHPHRCDVLVNMHVPPGPVLRDYDLRVVGPRRFGENSIIKTVTILILSNSVLAAGLIVCWYGRRIGISLQSFIPSCKGSLLEKAPGPLERN